MSVTFALLTTDADWDNAPYVIDCECPGATPITFPSARLAWAWADHRNATPDALRALPHGCASEICRECDLHPQPVATWYEAEINVAAANGRTLLELLGLYPDAPEEDPMMLQVDERATTQVSGEDFLGRVLLASAMAPTDEGVPTYGEDNFIFCGRSAGYTETRLGELRDLAQTAISLGRDVVWS